MAGMQQSSDPRVADLVRTGKLRVALFPPQYMKDAATGEIRGVWVEVVRRLGEHIGIPVVVIELSNPNQLAACLASGACDIGAMGFDPARVSLVGGFTPPFMRVDYTFLVPAGSPIHSSADVDRPGLRIAAVSNHASTLKLSRMLTKAEQVDTETPEEAFDLLRSGRVDAWASIRPTLLEFSAKLPGSRVLADSYGVNWPALVVQKGQDVLLDYLSAFVEQAKASGQVQQAIDLAGFAGYSVAPPGRG
jgi:polar amino acid transport system substrate-binding protein